MQSSPVAITRRGSSEAGAAVIDEESGRNEHEKGVGRGAIYSDPSSPMKNRSAIKDLMVTRGVADGRGGGAAAGGATTTQGILPEPAVVVRVKGYSAHDEELMWVVNGSGGDQKPQSRAHASHHQYGHSQAKPSKQASQSSSSSSMLGASL